MILHVRYDGRSLDLDMLALRLNGSPSDGAIRRAVARHLDIAPAKLDAYVVDRCENGNLILRPQAVYG
jgi:hypothetical protein